MKNFKKFNTLEETDSITTDNTGSNTMLAAGISYTIGKFQMLLNEETGDLRVIVHTNSDSLKIQPKSDNSIVLHACR